MTSQTTGRKSGLTPGQINKRLAAKGEYTLMMWNHTHRSTKSGTFAFAPDLATATRMAHEYVGYLPENQVQVSETGTHPIKVVLRLWNHNERIFDPYAQLEVTSR